MLHPPRLFKCILNLVINWGFQNIFSLRAQHPDRNTFHASPAMPRHVRTRHSQLPADSEDDVTSEPPQEDPAIEDADEDADEDAEAAGSEKPNSEAEVSPTQQADQEDSTPEEEAGSTTEELPATVDKDDEEEEDEGCLMSCATEEGITECLVTWEGSDGFLNCSDPWDAKVSKVLDFCAFQCGAVGQGKKEFIAKHKTAIVEVWTARHRSGPSQHAQPAADALMEGADYVGEASRERDLAKKYKDSPDWILVDEGADPKVALTDRGLIMYDPHDHCQRIHTLAKHMEAGKAAAVGALAHGLPVVLRKHPLSKFVMLFFPGDLNDDEQRLELQHGEMMVAQLRLSDESVKLKQAAKDEGIEIEEEMEVSYSMMHWDNKKLVPNKLQRVQMVDVLAYGTKVLTEQRPAINEWDNNCDMLRLYRQEDPASQHILSHGDGGFAPMFKTEGFAEIRKVSGMARPTQFSLVARCMSAQLHEVFVREKVNLPRDGPSADTKMNSLLRRSVEVCCNGLADVTATSILKSTPTVSCQVKPEGELGSKRPAPSSSSSHPSAPAVKVTLRSCSELGGSDKMSDQGSDSTTFAFAKELKAVKAKLEAETKARLKLSESNRKFSLDLHSSKQAEQAAKSARDSKQAELKKQKDQNTILKKDLGKAEDKLSIEQQKRAVAVQNATAAAIKRSETAMKGLLKKERSRVEAECIAAQEEAVEAAVADAVANAEAIHRALLRTKEAAITEMQARVAELEQSPAPLQQPPAPLQQQPVPQMMQQQPVPQMMQQQPAQMMMQQPAQMMMQPQMLMMQQPQQQPQQQMGMMQPQQQMGMMQQPQQQMGMMGMYPPMR